MAHTEDGERRGSFNVRREDVSLWAKQKKNTFQKVFRIEGNFLSLQNCVYVVFMLIKTVIFNDIFYVKYKQK